MSEGGRRLRVAVNLASAERTSVNDSGLASDQIGTSSTVSASVEPGPSEELWVFLLVLALLLLVAEWVTYHRRLTEELWVFLLVLALLLLVAEWVTYHRRLTV